MTGISKVDMKKSGGQGLDHNASVFQNLFAHSPYAICLFHTDGTFRRMNEAAFDLSGYTLEQLQGLHFKCIIHPDDLQRTTYNFNKVITEGCWLQYQFRITTPNELNKHIEVANFPYYEDDQLMGVVAICKVVEDAFLPYRDKLTGRPNRDGFEVRIQESIERKECSRFSIVLIKLSRYRALVETFGKHIGDEFILLLVSLMEQLLPDNSTIGRLEMDEFAVYLPDKYIDQELSALAERLIEAISTPHELNGLELKVNCHIGMTRYSDDGQSMEDLMRHTNIALHHAKKLGRNSYKFYADKLDAINFRTFTLEHDLRKALANEELFVMYQPRFHALKQNVVAAEVLVRWNHPLYGLISPAEFIPIAEQTGVIIPIGKWVLQQACWQNKQWQLLGLPPMKISVNVSIQQLYHEDFVQVVQTTLAETGLEPQWLELEITESCIADNFELISSFVQGLGQLGVSIAIDDFGTGYSSFGFIRDYAVNTVKIDKSFIQNIADNKRNETVCKGIINLMLKLESRVVAEGVETYEQLDLLNRMNCNEIQGFLLSKPVAPTEFLYHLQNNWR